MPISAADNKDAAVEPLLRDILVSFVRIHLLHHASEAPVCGVEMIAELARHGYRIGPGTIYPTLHGLRDKGLLRDEEWIVAGKLRKYYRTTRAGNRALRLLRPRLRELVDEVLNRGQAPASRPVPQKGQPQP